MPTTDPAKERTALQTIIEVLSDLPQEAQRRLLTAASVFLDIGDANIGNRASEVAVQDRASLANSQQRYSFTGHSDLSPKDFVLEKRPQTDVDRIACLAFYMTHYRDTPHFNTTDLRELNSEAAQVNFSNPTQAANNALRAGLLTTAGKGKKQLTAAGEQYVAALPDTQAARAAAAAASPKRTRRSKSYKRAPKPRGPEHKQ